MSEREHEFSEGVTLLGGGPVEAEGLEAALARAPRLICADGGANRLLGLDRAPEAIIGDLDSLAEVAAWRRRLGPRLRHVVEQDTTDFEKCLRLVDAPFFIGAGFLGGRADHALAAFHALIADPRPIVLIGEADVALAAGAGLELALAPGDRVSVFPLAPLRASGRGLKWNFEDLAMAAGGRIGTSNEAAGPLVRLSFDRPGAIVLLAAERLDAALQALQARDRGMNRAEVGTGHG